MAQKSKEYHKLPGSKKGFLIGKYTLWQGSDHLLQIFSRVGVEEYKRFYFNDIQAVITRKTAVGTIQNIVLGCLVLIFILPAISFDGGWSLFYAIVAAVVLFLLLVGIYRGPTCETKLMTAVQTEKLHTLHRLKNTSKVMDSLRVNIHRTQGALKREALNKIPTRPLKNQNTHRQAPPRSSRITAHRNEKGRAHMGLFLLLLIDGVLVSLGFFFTHVILTIISTIASLGMGIFVIVALVKQHDSSMSGSLKAITWASLGFICINFAAGYVVNIVFAMQNPGVVYNQWEMLKSMSLLSPWESPLKLSFDIFAICGALFLGIPGLFMLYRSDSGLKAEATVTAVNYRKPAALRNTEPG
jgi:ABC-type multidrug transport system fused ATPase/permease subunit